MDVELQNLKKGDFIDMDKTTKPSKNGIKTKHITSIKNTLNSTNTKAKPESTVLKENDWLLSYKDKKSITLFHQNITGLRVKTNELLSHLYPNFPDVLCFTEHHLNQSKLKQIYIENYRLGTSYSRLSTILYKVFKN
jgi:hypothetical protein